MTRSVPIVWVEPAELTLLSDCPSGSRLVFRFRVCLSRYAFTRICLMCVVKFVGREKLVMRSRPSSHVRRRIIMSE